MAGAENVGSYPLEATVRRFGVAFALLFLISKPVLAGDEFPGQKWSRYRRPEDAGWSSPALEEAKRLSAATVSTSWVLVQGGKIVADWGQVDKPVLVHSMRKSILSALYGIYVAEGKVKLDVTLKDLGIDDKPPSLTRREKTAKVIDLLEARSGVYHPAACEPDSMKRKRPERGSHAPGTFWYYNNWDFNALGTIFERQTGRRIFDAFDRDIAHRIGMEDFVEARDAKDHYEKGSEHPCYLFNLSSHDMARFGLLYLNRGRWKNQQVVPASWVEDSTTSYSDAGEGVGYGYLWWVGIGGRHLGQVFPGKVYSARGSKGQYLVVAPEAGLVFALNVDGKDGLSTKDFKRVFAAIMKAREKPLAPANAPEREEEADDEGSSP